MKRATSLAVVLLLALASAPLRAKRKPLRTIERFGFRLRVADGWQEIPSTRPQAMLVLANKKTGQTALVSRIVGPNDLENISPSVVAGLEQQIKGKTVRYKRISSQRRVFGRRNRKTVAYDLWFGMRRDHKKIVMGTRFLFYPGYTLALTVDSSGNATLGETRKMLKSFQPFFPD